MAAVHPAPPHGPPAPPTPPAARDRDQARSRAHLHRAAGGQDGPSSNGGSDRWPPRTDGVTREPRSSARGLAGPPSTPAGVGSRPAAEPTPFGDRPRVFPDCLSDALARSALTT